eukprot:14300459-Alexandrium_andersonii.AAC.1
MNAASAINRESTDCCAAVGVAAAAAAVVARAGVRRRSTASGHQGEARRWAARQRPPGQERSAGGSRQ